MLKRVFLIPLFLIGIITGCKKESTTNPAIVPTINPDGVPYVSVNLQLNTQISQYCFLQFQYGCVEASGGYDGILVYCQTQNKYFAFDMACPYDCKTNSKAIICLKKSNTTISFTLINTLNATDTLVCPICGTTYSLLGNVINGPGTEPLLQYKTSVSYGIPDNTVGDPTINVSN